MSGLATPEMPLPGTFEEGSDEPKKRKHSPSRYRKDVDRLASDIEILDEVARDSNAAVYRGFNEIRDSLRRMMIVHICTSLALAIVFLVARYGR